MKTQGFSIIARNATGATQEVDLDALVTAAAEHVSRLTRSESQAISVGQALMSCSYLVSPRTLAAVLGQERDRLIPEENLPPSNVIAGLAAQQESADLTLTAATSDGLPRVFLFDTVRLDAGTSFGDIVIAIYVGGVRVARFDGAQLNPDTGNTCISRALCETRVCVGAMQDLTIRVRNSSSSPFGATASIRIHGRVAFPGDPQFTDCWSGACDATGVTARIDAAAACSCATPTTTGRQAL